MPKRSRVPFRITLSLFSFLLLSLHLAGADVSPSAKCIECHSKTTPNIVSDWKLSKHSGADIGCAVCHGDEHTSASDVAKVKIPTPDTCADCHSDHTCWPTRIIAVVSAASSFIRRQTHFASG